MLPPSDIAELIGQLNDPDLGVDPWADLINPSGLADDYLTDAIETGALDRFVTTTGEVVHLDAGRWQLADHYNAWA